MEPMTLGSPMASPSTSNLGGNSPNSSTYLPSFLMGSEPPVYASSSPTKRTTRSPNFAINESFNLNLSQKIDQVNRSTQEMKEKPGGPPTIGLFDTLPSFEPPKASGPNTFRLQASARQALRNSFSPVSMSSPISHNRSVSENTADHSNLMQRSQQSSGAEHWVTVFGFPPSAASVVLAYFSQIGRVEETKQPNHGNWINIRYYSKMDARRAVYQNGKVFSGSIMVGVAPCKDSSILKDVTNNMNLISPEKPSLTSRIITNLANKVLPSSSIPGTPSDQSNNSFQSPTQWASPDAVQTPASSASPMVGTPKSILKSPQSVNKDKLKNWPIQRSVSFQTPDSSVAQAVNSTPEAPKTFSTPSSIRKLMSPLSPISVNSSFIPNGENEVLQAHNIPRKSSGVVSKTIDYFLGW